MAVWFEGENEIDCSIQQVKQALEDYGKLFVGVVRLMPGLTSVELVEQGSDFVTYKTNEGITKRTNIAKLVEAERVVVEFDEEVQPVSSSKIKITVNTHYLDEFSTSETGITHHMVLSNVKATGFLGFFYRNFGKSNIGNALLKSYKTYFETQNTGGA